jgi:hypothetical protein
MDDDENSLLWYFIEVDTPNYELIDNEDEDVHVVMVALDVQRSYCRPRRSVPREHAD